ncbi:unnamed protein product [Urochloa decumbens]|uniref:TFIIS N-terminal domain-containing protein n=1 Tax=Urochloa decumbens TaxID=240449 RepID=A0ABC8WVH8_9POAL
MASGPTCTVRSEAGDILDKVTRINGELASERGNEAVLESLRQLQAVPMTFEALETTKVGRAVNAVRKSAPSEQVRGLAAALYRSWKALADEHFAARQATTAPAAPTGDAATSVDEAPKVDRIIARSSPINKEKSQSVGPNSSSAGSRPVTMPRPSVVEAKLEATAMPAIVKKQRSIRLVIKKAEPHPAVVQHPAVLQTAVTPDLTPTPPVSKWRPSGSNQKSSVSTVAANLQGPGVAKRVSPATSAASLTTKAEPPAALPKQPRGWGACKRKEAPPAMAFDEARLTRAKMRLHVGYKEASTLKEKRKIQVIAEPGKGRPRPSQVRCTAASGTGKRPPVPSCPRMLRAA